MRSKELNRNLNTKNRTTGYCPADSVSARILTFALYPERRFQLCGTVGLTLAIMLARTLTRHAGLSYWVMAGIVAMAVATFLVLVMATKIITGEEQIIYYHHEIAVMVVAGLFLWAMRQPLLTYLDITITSIGLFLSFGRIGCLLVGCCYGRPHSWGIRYTEKQARSGFPSYLVGVRLFPIQAVESIWALGTVVVGTYLVWSGHSPGTALGWYVVIYDVGRFAFEFVRGDADRPYWIGFSQAQWLALLLTGGVVWAERAGVLPLSPWHLVVLASLAATMIAVSLKRRFQRTSTFRLLHPRHIQQIASAIKGMSASAGSAIAVPDKACTVASVARTSLGIQISGGRIDGGRECLYHYTLSGGNEPMTESTARILARLVRYLSGATGSEKFVAGNHGIFHCLIHEPKVPKRD